MMEPVALRHFTNRDGLDLAYQDLAGPDAVGASPALCIPGLTRNHRDFEDLAPRLARTRRVLCADLRGRGSSAYDPQPARYVPPTYAADLVELLDHAEVDRVVIVGTSLGGLLAMLLAATHPERVDRIVLNDIGPEIDPKGLARIQSYVGRSAPVTSWEEAGAAAKEVYGLAFPGLSDDEWIAQARRGSARGEDGTIRPDYDPRISEAAGAPGAAPDLWPLWSSLRGLPILVLRGETSDILSESTVDRMAREKPDLVRVTVPERGHAPLLDEPASVVAIEAFLGG